MCADGFYEQFGKCVVCPSQSSVSIGQVIGISAAIIGLCGVVYLVRALLPVDVIKLGVSMLQVSSCCVCGKEYVIRGVPGDRCTNL